MDLTVSDNPPSLAHPWQQIAVEPKPGLVYHGHDPTNPTLLFHHSLVGDGTHKSANAIADTVLYSEVQIDMEALKMSQRASTNLSL